MELPFTPENGRLPGKVRCTLETDDKVKSLKRKASELAADGPPDTTAAFLRWRLAFVENQLELLTIQIQALKEEVAADEAISTRTQEFDAMKKKEKGLLHERVLLISKKPLEADLNDFGPGKEALASAYIQEMRTSLFAASSEKKKPLFWGRKQPSWDRDDFFGKVGRYLGSYDEYKYTGDGVQWCHVLGAWLHPGSTICAHIVPYSWNTKELAYTFGADEPKSASKRNGLSLQRKIGAAFDNCWITIVPVNTVETNPTQ
ncbi:MAG: hypothetical protein Q9182_001044 [Xanthomendoza sp. 2 TL-2023]